jgi:hypothetical protein
LLLHNWVPKSVEAATGPIKAVYELGVWLGSGPILAALSFVAYLIGSILRVRPSSNFRGVLSIPYVIKRVLDEARAKQWHWLLGFAWDALLLALS